MNVGGSAVKILKAAVFDSVGKFMKAAFSQKYLLYTNVSLSCCLSGAGDVLEQRYEIFTEELEGWDKQRTVNMSATGITVGVVCHYSYKFLDRGMPGHTIRMVMKKILVDQVVCSPLCIATFFGTLAFLEDTSCDDFIDNLKKKAWKLYAAEWVIWPIAQFVNFYFLTNKYRVLYDNTISLGYDVYTSHVAHSDRNKEKTSQENC